MFRVKTVKIIICLSLYLGGSLYGQKPENKPFQDMIDSVGAVACAWSYMLTNTVLHEYGHAIPARILLNNPLKVSMGSPESAPLYSGKYCTIKKDFLFPKNGYFGCADIKADIPKTGARFACAAACGPLAGLMLPCGFVYAAHRYQQEGQYRYAGYLNALATFGATVELSNAVVRRQGSQHSDGSYFCRALNFSPRVTTMWSKSVKGVIAGTWLAGGSKLWSLYQSHKQDTK